MKRKLMLAAGSVMTTLGLAVGASAAETIDTEALMQTAMTGAQTDLMGILAIAVPIVVGIAVAVVAVKFGVKWVKKLGS